jgi:hypothetical protein
MAQKKKRCSTSVWNEEMEIYIDPEDEWIAEHSGKWSEKYPGKYLAIVDCQVVAVEDTRKAAYEKLEQLYPEWFYETDLTKVPLVLYIPLKDEMEMIL